MSWSAGTTAETSSGIQNLRANADQDIASSVQGVNTDLQQIASLNAEIKQEAASGQSTADLEDQRNTALQDIASKMNVSYYTTSSGDLQVYTSSGQALVDASGAHTISYTAASDVTSSTTYASGGFSGMGFKISPAVGLVMSELICGDKMTVDISAFRPQRFAEGQPIRAEYEYVDD